MPFYYYSGRSFHYSVQKNIFSVQKLFSPYRNYFLADRNIVSLGVLPNNKGY